MTRVPLFSLPPSLPPSPSPPSFCPSSFLVHFSSSCQHTHTRTLFPSSNGETWRKIVVYYILPIRDVAQDCVSSILIVLTIVKIRGSQYYSKSLQIHSRKSCAIFNTTTRPHWQMHQKVNNFWDWFVIWIKTKFRDKLRAQNFTWLVYTNTAFTQWGWGFN